MSRKRFPCKREEDHYGFVYRPSGICPVRIACLCFMKKFAAPLQAIAMLLLCSGMVWMVFVLASINPTPPTLDDLQARTTQDLSFASMNSTAVALAQQMLAEIVPSPPISVFLPVTGRGTATPVTSAAVTLKAVLTYASLPAASSTPIPATATRRKSDRPTSTSQPTVVPTNTPKPPTQTATLTLTATKPPTLTPQTPTETPTPVVPTETPETPVAPTPSEATPEPSPTPAEPQPTDTLEPDPTATEPPTP
jgi:hypothetical protein